MEKEISSGSMLGIVLIALAMVIGLGFSVFAIAKGVANDGVVTVQDNLDYVSDSSYTDYEQKIVSGTTVMSAYKIFEGKPVAILINTNAMNNSIYTYAEHEKIYSQEINGLNYINYNAILANDSEGNISNVSGGAKGGVVVPSGNSGVFTLTSGVVNTLFGFCIDASGKAIFDSSISGFSKRGNSEYIAPISKFNASVIKDSSGNIVGLAFTQLVE